MSYLLESTKFYALLALATGPMHGAAIRDQINGDTTGVYLRDSTLYDLLKSMVRAELIEQLPGKKYRLTEKGRRKLELESRTLREAVSLSQQRLGWR